MLSMGRGTAPNRPQLGSKPCLHVNIPKWLGVRSTEVILFFVLHLSVVASGVAMSGRYRWYTSSVASAMR
jgi:hypothetical protein